MARKRFSDGSAVSFIPIRLAVSAIDSLGVTLSARAGLGDASVSRSSEAG
jgi:hypothetical protein